MVKLQKTLSKLKLDLQSTINSVRRLKETIAYSKQLSRESIDKMKIYNHRGIEVDDIDISDLKNDILYLDLNGDEFSVNNYINEYKLVKLERTTTLKDDSAKYFNSKLSLAIPKERTHNSSSITSRSTRQRTIQ